MSHIISRPCLKGLTWVLTLVSNDDLGTNPSSQWLGSILYHISQTQYYDPCPIYKSRIAKHPLYPLLDTCGL